MYVLCIFVTLESVCVPSGVYSNWGRGWGRKLRAHMMNTVPLSGGINFHEDWRYHFSLKQFYYGECKNHIFKTEHEISSAGCFWFCSRAPSPKTFMLLCFRIMLVEKFEKQTLKICHFALILVTSVILLCSLF